jgi:hypothetical protein
MFNSVGNIANTETVTDLIELGYIGHFVYSITLYYIAIIHQLIVMQTEYRSTQSVHDLIKPWFYVRCCCDIILT